MKMINIDTLTNETYTMQEIATLLNVTPRTITNYCLNGILPYILTTGNHKRVKKQDLIQYLKSKELLIINNSAEINLYDIIYARTNSSQQHLERQVEKICRQAIYLNPRNVLILCELYNDAPELKEFQKMITFITQKKVRRIFMLRTEIITKIEMQLLQGLCKKFNIKLIMIK